MPTATEFGAVGIDPGPSLLPRSSGGMPSKMHNRLFASRRAIPARNQHLRRGQVRLRLVDVQLARLPPLNRAVAISRIWVWSLTFFPCIGQLLFQGPVLHIVGGHVADQRHEHIVVVLDRGVEGCLGRLDGAAEAAPEIELQARPKP